VTEIFEVVLVTQDYTESQITIRRKGDKVFTGKICCPRQQTLLNMDNMIIFYVSILE